MSNTITETVSGKQAYETFSGQTDGADATSTDFTLLAPAGQKWIVKAVSGENFMRPSDTSFNDINSGFTKTYDAGSVCLSQFSYLGVAANLTNLMRFAGASSTIYHSLQGHRLMFFGGYANTGIFAADTSFSATFGASEIYTVQSLFKSGRYMFTVWRGAVKIFSTEAPASLTTFPTGSGTKWWGTQSGGTSHYVGRALLCAGGVITFAGLTAGMVINILNSATDAVEYSLYASGASASIDLAGVAMLPLNKKIQVIGTDGSVLLTTTSQTIFGGSTWTYSGATAGVTKSRKRIIIDGGVIG